MQELLIGLPRIAIEKEGGIMLRHLGIFAVAAKVSLGTASRTEPGNDCLTHAPERATLWPRNPIPQPCWTGTGGDGGNMDVSCRRNKRSGTDSREIYPVNSTLLMYHLYLYRHAIYATA